MDLPILHLVPLLFSIGAAAGFVDSIAGGGGIISVSALLFLGVPPHFALGTNKLQSSFGSLSASINYARKGLVEKKGVLECVAFTAAGAVIGTTCIQRLSPDILERIIPVLLAGVFLYVLLSRNFGQPVGAARMGGFAFCVLFGMSLGFYDGFFGPGTGSFWALAYVALQGLDLKRATARTKIMNFTSNAVSLATFIAGAHVLFLPGLCMGAGQVLGATLGSGLAAKKGVGFIRVFFLIMVAATVAKLIYSTYF